MEKMNRSKLSVFIRSYWDYYIELESEFFDTQKYVAFDKHNYHTFSVEYLKLLQAVCSEIDVVAKEIAVALEPGFKIDKSTNIQKWGYLLQTKLPQILNTKVVFNHDIIVCPWEKWIYEKTVHKNGRHGYKLRHGTRTPEWWNAYNAVKHTRTTEDSTGKRNFTKANLANLVMCYAALYILETEYITLLSGEQEPIANPVLSRLFQLYYPQFPDLIY